MLSYPEKIKAHIQNGDLYEMNFCREYFATDAEIEPINTFQKLNDASKAPFASLQRNRSFTCCAQS